MFLRQIKFNNLFTFICIRFLYREHKIRVNGFNINFIQVGNGEKSIMLLPGTMGTAWTHFRPQLESLPELLPNHKIIAWDPPGYGKSLPPSRDVGLDCFHKESKIAVNIMRTLCREKFSVMGWSAGAFTAIIIAGCFPEFVDRLILWGAGTYLNKDDITAIEALRDINNWSESMRESFEHAYAKKRFNELLTKSIDCLSNFYEVRNGNICTNEAKKVTAPTFILRGAKDPFWSPEHVPYLLKILPCCKYHEFPNGKHNIHLRYSEDFNKMVAEFLIQNERELQRISMDEIYLQNYINLNSQFE